MFNYVKNSLLKYFYSSQEDQSELETSAATMSSTLESTLDETFKTFKDQVEPLVEKIQRLYSSDKNEDINPAGEAFRDFNDLYVDTCSKIKKVYWEVNVHRRFHIMKNEMTLEQMQNISEIANLHLNKVEKIKSDIDKFINQQQQLRFIEAVERFKDSHESNSSGI
jgi:hypothetical protein